MTPSRVAERVWQAMADPIDVSATSYPPPPPASLTLSLSPSVAPPPLPPLTHALLLPPYPRHVSLPPLPLPCHRHHNSRLILLSSASPSTASSPLPPHLLTSTPIAPTHRTKSRSCSPPLLLSSLFTMAMRYSHYPPCTSPSNRLHRDDDDDDGDEDCEKERKATTFMRRQNSPRERDSSAREFRASYHSHPHPSF